jgi:hypothetical protein
MMMPVCVHAVLVILTHPGLPRILFLKSMIERAGDSELMEVWNVLFKRVELYLSAEYVSRQSLDVASAQR